MSITKAMHAIPIVTALLCAKYLVATDIANTKAKHAECFASGGFKVAESIAYGDLCGYDGRTQIK